VLTARAFRIILRLHINRISTQTCGGELSEQAGAKKKTLLHHFRLVSLLTLGSRVLGMARDVAMAVMFGNGVIFDSFTLAFRLPNLARTILGEGTLSTAFLPVYVREMMSVGPQAADRLASVFLLFLVALLGTIVVVFELGVLGLSLVVSLSDEFRLLLELNAIMFPYILLICLSAQLNAVLNAREHFAWPALMPWVLNLTWLVAVLASWWLMESPTRQIQFISVSIILGGIAQLVGSWLALKRCGFVLSRDIGGEAWKADWERVKGLLWSLTPILLSLSVTQLNTLLDSVIAWGLAYVHGFVEAGGLAWLPKFSDGSASALYIGQRLYQFPLGIFGVALGTVLYPRLTKARHEDGDAFAQEVIKGLRLILLLGLPASVGLCLMAQPVTETLFHHGAFDMEDVTQTSQMIVGYGVGVWAFMLLLIMNRAFYALEDRWTPLLAGFISVAVNIVMSFMLIMFLNAPGLAVATSVASAVQVGWLLWKLKQKTPSIKLRSLCRLVGISLIGCFVMGLVSNVLFPQLENQDMSTFWRGVSILTQIAVCAVAYGAVVVGMGVEEVRGGWKRS
jgi:putative peptidoglycan lipid II flippase